MNRLERGTSRRQKGDAGETGRREIEAVERTGSHARAIVGGFLRLAARCFVLMVVAVGHRLGGRGFRRAGRKAHRCRQRCYRQSDKSCDNGPADACGHFLLRNVNL